MRDINLKKVENFLLGTNKKVIKLLNLETFFVFKWKKAMLPRKQYSIKNKNLAKNL